MQWLDQSSAKQISSLPCLAGAPVSSPAVMATAEMTDGVATAATAAVGMP